MIKGFIFDLDGTLVDSMGFWDNIGEEFLKSKNLSPVPRDLRELLKPMSLFDAAEYFKQTFQLELTIEQIMQDINALIEDKYKYEIALKPGVQEFLEQHKHLKMCIATATDRHLVNFILERLCLKEYFDFIITSSEVGNSKREPDIFLQATQLLGLEQEEVVVFEDALHAIQTAKAAGFYVVGVADLSMALDTDIIQQLVDTYVYELIEYEVI